MAMEDGARDAFAPLPASFDDALGADGVGSVDDPSDGAGVGAAVAVKVADVATGAVTSVYAPAWVGVYAPVPVPAAFIVTVNVVIDESGAVTWTVCVEKAVKPVSVTVLGVPTAAADAVVIGEPGGAAVDAAPHRSDADGPMALTATMENVCQADELSPVAVYVVPGSSTAGLPSMLTRYLMMGDPPVFTGGDQLAVIAELVVPPNTRFVGASGTVASVDRPPVRGDDDPAPLTTVTENVCDVPGAKPLAVKVVVGVHVSVPPSTRT